MYFINTKHEIKQLEKGHITTKLVKSGFNSGSPSLKIYLHPIVHYKN